MIIPIRCVSCNNVLAGKWLTYIEKIKDTKLSYLTQTTTKSLHGKVLDELGITKQCCRRHMLTHVDL